MKKLLYVKDSEEYWKIFDREREKDRSKLARLSFARKVIILEQMQRDRKVTGFSSRGKTGK